MNDASRFPGHSWLAIVAYMLIAVPAAAQSFPTPAKTLCNGEPSLTSPTACNATATPAPFVNVFYAITLQPLTSGSVTLLESLPAGFTLVGASWTVVGSNQSTVLTGTTTSGVTALGPIPLTAQQTVVVFIRGYFSNPCSGVQNNVTVADASAQHNATVSCSLTFPSDLSVTKAVTPASVDVSNGPQTVTYTVVMKNNGPEPVYIGPIGGLFDTISTSANSVPLQVRILPGTSQCTSSPSTTSCVDPTPIGGALTTATTTPAPFAKWVFPATGTNAAGFMPPGGTITLTYKVEISRHPDLYCARGGEALHNEVFFGLTTLSGTTITETNNTNNTAASPDVSVSTGQQLDPDCGVPVPGPITVTKTQLSPAPSAPVAWNTPVTYRITVTNSDTSPIVVRLRDRVLAWAGTPPFTASVTACTPAAACAAPVLTPTATLTSYFSQATVWDKSNITVPGSGSVQLDLTITYVPNSCDSFAAGGDIIRNIARADYTFGSMQGISEGFTDTSMAPQPACNLVVTKQVLNTDRVAFDVPLSNPAALSYQVTFKNAGITPVTVGTLFDAVRIQQSNYASALPFSYSYACTASGSLTGSVPTTGTGSGTIVHTTFPSQGARIIQSGPIVFAPNASLACDVKLSVSRPAVGDPNCLSSVEPRLENLALMDVSQFYNANLQWPPSGNYSTTIPAGTSQPTTATNWSLVSVKLPRCHRLVVNKSVTPGVTWAPGGPALSYTVTITNAGDTLTNSGLVIGDQFLAPWASLAPFITVSSNCTSPSAFWGSWSGTSPAVLPVLSFPPGCSIFLDFTLPSGLKPGPICNTGFAEPPGAPDWYAANPDPALVRAEVCLQVLEANDLNVTKIVNNKAGVTLPANFVFPIVVSCNIPGGTTVSTTFSLGPNGTATIPNLPVGSNCWATELWSTLPVPGGGSCKPPATAAWLAPLYVPPSIVIVKPPARNTIEVTNTLECVMPPVNTLTVTKTFLPPSVVSQLPVTAVFPIQVQCSTGLSTVLNLMAPNYQQVVSGIPVGTTCSVTELPPQGTKIPANCSWSQTYPNGNSIVIPATGNPALVVQNELICKQLPIDIALAKSGPSPVAGTPYSMFTIDVTSPGGPFTIPPGGLTVTDTATGAMGVFFGISATPSASWTCTSAATGGSCVYNGPGPTTQGQLLGTITVYYQPFMPSSYVNCATATLTPTAGGVPLESSLTNNTSCVQAGSASRVDVGITKSGPHAFPLFPTLAFYSLTVTNGGQPFTMPAGGLQVTDVATNLPGTFLGALASPAAAWNCSASGSTGNCLYIGSGTIATGQVLGTISVYVHLPFAGGRYTNCATVGFTQIASLVDIVSTNNTACVTKSDQRRRAVGR